mgnify:CR=1 FL=1
MIGQHLFIQPLHQTLKQYRVIAVLSVTFIGYMMLKAWNFYEVNHALMSAESVVAFFTFVATLLGAFVKCVNNIQGRHEE